MPADSYETASLAQDLAVRRQRKRSARFAARKRALARPGAKPGAEGSPTQRQGHAAEARAAHYLQAQGLILLETNLRCRAGEIDLVARTDTLLVFIEVRQRRNRRYGGAAASVNRHKQARLIRAAYYFLPALIARYFAGYTPCCRFDVISIDAEQLEWITDAFRA